MNRTTHTIVADMLRIIYFQSLSWFVYYRLMNSFFQQDEWYSMGRISAMGLSRITQFGIADAFLAGIGRPLGALINHVLFVLFRFDTLPVAVFTIVMHGLVAYLVFLYLNRHTKRYIINFMLASVFVLSATAQPAITWFAASVTVLPAVAFLILSLLALDDYLNRNKPYAIYWTVILFYLSFLTKELGVAVGLYIAYLIYLKKRNIRTALVMVSPFMLFPVAVAVRFFIHQVVGDRQAQFYTVTASDGIIQKIYTIVTTALGSVSQALVYQADAYGAAIWLSGKIFGLSSPLSVDAMVSVLSVGITVCMIIGAIVLSRYKVIRRDVFLKGILLYVCLLFPYLMVRRPNAYMELRFYYSLLPALLLMGASIRFEKAGRLLAGLVLCAALVWAGINFFHIERVLQADIKNSAERKNIVQSLDAIDIRNSRHTIFHIESDEDYIVDGQSLPFFQGIGYTLMVIYYRQGVIPKDFLLSNKLWDMGSQGYETDGTFTFGYYSDADKMHEDIRKLPAETYTIVHVGYRNRRITTDRYQL